VWDSPELVNLARANDKLIARATESSRKPMAKEMSKVAKAWSLSYWITLALIFGVALLIRMASLAKRG
jgi:hypothetical protein